jgi:hypothetical protein
MTKKISDVEVSNTPLIRVNNWSKESYYMNPKYLDIVEGQDFDQYQRLSGYGASPINIDLPEGENPSVKAPSLSDIESVTKTVYYDLATKKARAKLVIKIRNSSTEPIIGIDARIAIAASDGGNS